MSCKYIIKRGKEKGNECCQDVYKNSNYCSKHYKHNSKKTVYDDILDSAIKINCKSASENELDFLEDEYGRYVNKSNYVINCPIDKVVIGRLDKQGELCYLNDGDVRWCSDNNLLFERFI